MTSALIGREHPAAVLDAEIERAATSHGGLVLVTGEAGIGKTALVTDAGQRAKRQGAMVLGGSCWDSAGAPGYWPWTQVVRALRRAAGPQDWANVQETAGDELAVLLGEAPDFGPGNGTGEFRLYDAVTTALVTASQRWPVVVVLDDLHWADAASVRLLEFAARHTWFERLLLVGTYRDAEVEPADHPLRPLLGTLAAKATMVTLTGLGAAEAGLLMSRTVGREPDPGLVAEVHRRTGGNPFFVEQTARLWQGGGTVSTIAPGVRDAVQRRLSLLAPPVAELLTSAAVLGREFHRRVLAATTDIPVPHVDRLLDQAVAARLMTALGGGRFAFAHDLVRETLYDALGEDEASAAHAGVVRALDRSPALAERMLPAEAAQHAHLAGDRIDPMRAVELLKTAADRASFRMSVEEEAAVHLRRALERLPADRVRERVLIILDLGRALRHGGDPTAAQECFKRAVELVRTLDDSELLGRVALASYRFDHPGEGAALLDEAHRDLVRDGAPAAAPLPRVQLAQELAAKIAVLARQGDDDEALTFGLWARHDTLLGLGTAPEREAITRELADLARRSGDRGTATFATSFRWVALLEQGDPRYLDAYRDFVALAEDEGTSTCTLASIVDQAIINTAQGRFEEAEARIAALLTSGEDGSDQEFGYMGTHLRWALDVLRGRFTEIDDLHRSLREQGYPQAELLEGIAAVQRGDTGTALRHLAAIGDQDQPYSRTVEPLWLRFLAQTAAASGDPELCERARTALLPYQDLWAVALFGCDISGPFGLWLGLIDAAQQRWDDAVARLTAAYRSADRLRARPWSVEARSRLGEVLAARAAPGDRGTARTLLTQASDEAAEMGMQHVADRTRRALAGLGAPTEPNSPNSTAGPGGSAGPAKPEPDARVFRFDGRVWALTFAGRTVHMPDAKGLRDLHELLGRPGAQIPAAALLSPEGGEVVTASRRMGGDPVLDDEARSRYKKRLQLLDEEIDRATGLGDDRRAAAYDQERAALLEELRAAAGLAGRVRRLGDGAERARKTVTARIRDTLRKLDQHHPELAAHLRATISTGATCTYQPEHDHPEPHQPEPDQPGPGAPTVHAPWRL
ncbi:ATP-binding protein [Actinomadura sp. 9N407]|uniref:ATP-binding protein n=1 Tax=Actinomadura sp. 9N407 TaxID=3375154 RepID=UPI0037AB9703